MKEVSSKGGWIPYKNIDFSCKHDVLIRNEDGNLIPMDEPFYESKEIASGTFRILSDGDYSYLVVGDDEALAIDTGYGCGNIREYCQSLTPKPVRYVANTHDHFDHTANNAYFDGAFMSKETKELATIPFPSFEGINFPKDYPIYIIEEGYKFQLGNRELETFFIPDHAVGSLAFLDKRERILFSGDEIMEFKFIKTSVENFAKNLEKLKARRDEFDWICAGADSMIDAQIVDNFLSCANHILAGNEGVEMKGLDMPKRPVEKELENITIFDRKHARPCDMKKNKEFDANNYKRSMTYSNITIHYDIRHIYEL